MRKREISGRSCPSACTCKASNGTYQRKPSGTMINSSNFVAKSAREPFNRPSKQFLGGLPPLDVGQVLGREFVVLRDVAESRGATWPIAGRGPAASRPLASWHTSRGSAERRTGSGWWRRRSARRGPAAAISGSPPSFSRAERRSPPDRGGRPSPAETSSCLRPIVHELGHGLALLLGLLRVVLHQRHGGQLPPQGRGLIEQVLGRRGSGSTIPAAAKGPAGGSNSFGPSSTQRSDSNRPPSGKVRKEAVPPGTVGHFHGQLVVLAGDGRFEPVLVDQAMRHATAPRAIPWDRSASRRAEDRGARSGKDRSPPARR